MRGLLDAGCSDLVYVLPPPEAVAACEAALQDLTNAKPLAHTRLRVLAGGASRTDSVRLVLRSGSVADDDIVLVHDPARPFTPAEPIRAVVAAIRAGAPAAVPVQPVTDTIKVAGTDGVITGTRDRATLRCLQSPQGFSGARLRAAVAAAGDPLAGPSEHAHAVPGHPNGLRVVSPFDFSVAESLLENVGMEGKT